MTTDFIENYPLYKKFKCKVNEYIGNLIIPSINSYCKKCLRIQTFKGKIMFANSYMNWSQLNDQIVNLFYECVSCESDCRYYHIYISEDLDYCQKTGQFPAWEIKMDIELKRILGKHSDLYQKGLICESQGYGIAAFSYYRRIVENIIDELLNSITDLINEEDKNKYLEALNLVKNTRVTQEKIQLIKDLLPPILKPDGINPLGILHSELSSGLHSESDEDCLEKAGKIKNILIFLTNQILASKKSAKTFSESMKSFLDKKTKSS